MIIQSKRACVLIGPLGSGKTTFYNKICNKQNLTKYGGNSVTQKVFMTESSYGSGFKVLDTPGVGTFINKYQHAIWIAAALSEGPLNSILLCVRFDRFDIMREQLKKSILPLKNYLSHVVVVITHWDKSENKNQDDQEVRTYVLNYFKVKNYILSSNQMNGEQLCQLIEAKMIAQPILVQMSETTLDSGFDLLDDDFELEIAVEEFVQKFQKISLATQEFIKGITDKTLYMDEILHVLTLWIKTQAEDLIEQFETQNNHKMSELYSKTNNIVYAYLFQIQLKRSIVDDLNSVVERIQQKMLIKADHPYNFIRQCPHCGLIWMKVSGCDGETTCGAFSSQDDLISRQPFSSNVSLKYENEQLQMIIKETEKIEKQKLQQKIKEQQNQNQSKNKGCGNKIIWKDMRLPIELMKELLDIGDFDFLADKRDDELATQFKEQRRMNIDEAIKNIEKQ
ncbi:hypothetical protein pb186bvf_009986 [Paramecium bursaria]